MLAVYLPDTARSLDSPPEILAGQSPAPQQWQESKLSLLLDYFRVLSISQQCDCTAPLSHGLQEKAEQPV